VKNIVLKEYFPLAKGLNDISDNNIISEDKTLSIFENGGTMQNNNKVKGVKESTNSDLNNLKLFIEDILDKTFHTPFSIYKHVCVIWNLPSYFYSQGINKKKPSIKEIKIYNEIINLLNDNKNNFNPNSNFDKRVSFLFFLETSTENFLPEKSLKDFFDIITKKITFNKITDKNWESAIKLFMTELSLGNFKDGTLNEYVSSIDQFKNVLVQIKTNGKFLGNKPIRSSQTWGKSKKVKVKDNDKVKAKDENKDCYNVSVFHILSKFLYNKSKH